MQTAAHVTAVALLSLSAAAYGAQATATDASRAAPRRVEGGKSALRMTFKIPRQSLGDALAEWSRQSGLQILYRDIDNTEEITVSGVSGEYSPIEALDLMLRASGLEYELVNDDTVRVIMRTTARTTSAPLRLAENGPADASPAPTAPSSDRNSQSADARGGEPSFHPNEARKREALEEVTVTGSRIRGTSDVEDLAAPGMKFTREDFEKSGFNNVLDIFDSLPQNFDNTASEARSGTGNAQQSGNGINLRGLGSDTTLVLVNGARRASLNTVDVGAIPLAMLESVEIVTGGRSAMYGSDAIGGVVNFRTRRDFEGVQVQTQYRDARNSDPGMQASVVGGMKESRGGFVLGYNYGHTGKFDAMDTGLLANPDFSGRVYFEEPFRGKSTSHAGMLSGRFELREGLDFYADALHSSGSGNSFTRTRARNALNDTTSMSSSESDQFGYTAGLKLDLPRAWQATLEGQHTGDVRRSFSDNVTGTGASISTSRQRTETGEEDTIGLLQFEGPLPSIGGITPRLAIGGEYQKQRNDNENYTTSNGVARTPILQYVKRDIKAAFAEMLLPLVENGARRGLRRLELSLAGRYEEYSDFGTAFTPQAGVIWAPLEGFTLRSSYSEAFKAPHIRQFIGGTVTPVLIDTQDPGRTGGTSPLLRLGGTYNPSLGPEESSTWSAGFDFRPAWAPGARLSVSYYSIDYDGRIGIPAQGSDLLLLLTREENYASLITRSPTAQQVDDMLAITPTPLLNATSRTITGPVTGTNLLALFPGLVLYDGRINNIAVEEVRGIDLRADASRETPVGQLSFGLNGTYQIEHISRITPTAPAVQKLNEVAKPVDLRLRAHIGWQWGAWTSHVFGNYVDSYANPYQTPTGRMASWTTVDLSVGVDTGEMASARWLPSELRLNLSARNLFDRRPPLMGGPLIAAQVLRYDPTNSSAEGRILMFQAIKSW